MPDREPNKEKRDKRPTPLDSAVENPRSARRATKNDREIDSRAEVNSRLSISRKPTFDPVKPIPSSAHNHPRGIADGPSNRSEAASKHRCPNCDKALRKLRQIAQDVPPLRRQVDRSNQSPAPVSSPRR